MIENIKKFFNGNIVLFFLFIYYIFKPIYLFESGMPQVADYFLILICIYLFFNKNDKKNLIETNEKKIINYKYRTIYLFVAWIILISLISSFVLESISLLKPSLFYIFNALAVWMAKELYYKFGDIFIKKSLDYISIGCFIQMIISIFLTISSDRANLLFNNPNQLGLYSLICLTFILYFSTKYKIKLLYYISIVSTTYLILISLSKAAIIGALMLITIKIIIEAKKSIIKFFILMCTITFFVTGLFNSFISYIDNIDIINSAMYRIENIEKENDSNLRTGRGYDRLLEIRYNMIWGVGEGEFNRFDSLKGKEIHSAYASIICYYGIIGLLLLLFFLYKSHVFYYKNLIYYIGIFAYGITHQIWRNTLLWLFIEITCIVICHKQAQDKRRENENINIY